MNIRTDLAADISEQLPEDTKGSLRKTETKGDITVSTVQILSEEGERAYGKPIGTYITVEFPQLYKIADFTDLKNAVREALTTLCPKKRETLLVAGLGNTEITADAIGPHTAGHILATRHITGQFAESVGLKNLKSVSVITPGVLGRTGIEATELIKGAVDTVKPDAVLVIDALASNSVSRLFKTVQLCDSGISPGSGVKNSRKEISRKTLGLPVIAVGVPTVVDAGVLAVELTGADVSEDVEMLVTPKDSDLLCDRISEVLSSALNVFLQPEIDEKVIAGLV